MTFRIERTPEYVMRTRPEDYDAWMDMHDKIRWTFARTMPGTPHSYMVKGKNVSEEVYWLAYQVRRTWGVPGKFYSRTQLYLTHRDNPDIRYWSLDVVPEGSELINMADDGKSYGVQDAPVTWNDRFAEYDEISCWWDWQYRDLTELDKANLWRLVHNYVGVPKPSMIDVGAGTGASIESQAAASTQTLAIDPSQGMLNDLVVKFPEIKEVYPGTFAEWMDQADPKTQSRDVVVASTGSGSYLSPEEIAGTTEFAKRLTVLSFYGEVPSHRRHLPATHEDALHAARSLPNAQEVKARGGYTYVAVRST